VAQHATFTAEVAPNELARSMRGILIAKARSAA
jgi:hypothetical protein